MKYCKSRRSVLASISIWWSLNGKTWSDAYHIKWLEDLMTINWQRERESEREIDRERVHVEIRFLQPDFTSWSLKLHANISKITRNTLFLTFHPAQNTQMCPDEMFRCYLSISDISNIFLSPSQQQKSLKDSSDFSTAQWRNTKLDGDNFVLILRLVRWLIHKLDVSRFNY